MTKSEQRSTLIWAFDEWFENNRHWVDLHPEMPGQVYKQLAELTDREVSSWLTSIDRGGQPVIRPHEDYPNFHHIGIGAYI